MPILSDVSSHEAQDTPIVSGHIMDVTHKLIWLRWWGWQMPSVRAETVRQESQHSSWLPSQKLVKMRNSIWLGVQVLSRYLVAKAWQAGHFMPQLPALHSTEPYRLLAPSCCASGDRDISGNVWHHYRDAKVTQLKKEQQKGFSSALLHWHGHREQSFFWKEL